MTMLEKAARAIHAIDSASASERVASSMWTSNRVKVYEKLSRAVLEAIREPSEAMLIYCAWDCVYPTAGPSSDAEEWKSAIDAILEEKA
jgi:hypothetical protein